MPTEVIINGERFEEQFSPQFIDGCVGAVARRLNTDYAHKNPILLVVLNGSFMYAADLVRRLNFPHELQFIKLASYEGMESTGDVKTLIGLDPKKLRDRDIIIVEDIVDTGKTLNNLMPVLKDARSVEITSAVFKRDKLEICLNIKYPAITIPGDPFILGYGMDYDGAGRNLGSIYYHV